MKWVFSPACFDEVCQFKVKIGSNSRPLALLDDPFGKVIEREVSEYRLADIEVAIEERLLEKHADAVHVSFVRAFLYHFSLLLQVFGGRVLIFVRVVAEHRAICL